ncbi:MAG TPA: S53 family peptidase, partial [Ktedonobacterales bacterium]|nr:S53 family peptidase [Ktedonobacterales bacterium]
MPKLWNWTSALTHMTNRRALQALTLAAVAAISIALPALGGSSASILRAQNGPPPLHAHTHHAIPLNGSVPRALQKAKRTGVESGGRQLNLVISLQLADPNGLATLIANQQNAKSPQYHHYLTAQQFISRFAPSAQAVAAVRQFLSSSGLKVTGVSANRTLISAKGSVAQAERVFGVSILQYQLGKRTVYGPDRAPLIPDTLAGYVLNIAGLDNVLVAKPLLQDEIQATATKTTQASKTKAATGAGPGGGYTPSQLRNAYDVTSLYNAGGTGSGQRLAVFELAPYIPSDLSHYQSTYFLPSGGLNNHSVDGASPTCTTAGSACDNGSGIIEADLDVEVAAALAPSSTLDVYTGPNSSQGLLDTYNQIVLDNVDNVTTTSWGLCEPLTGDYMLDSLDQIFAQAASQGQTIAAASGDAGSDDCSRVGYSTGAPTVDSPASDPYVLGVGGTTLNMSGGGITYGSESTWNSQGGAGGGGISSDFMQPSWQVGGGVVNTYSTGEREVPDVSADSDPNTGYSVYCSS